MSLLEDTARRIFSISTKLQDLCDSKLEEFASSFANENLIWLEEIAEETRKALYSTCTETPVCLPKTPSSKRKRLIPLGESNHATNSLVSPQPFPPTSEDDSTKPTSTTHNHSAPKPATLAEPHHGDQLPSCPASICSPPSISVSDTATLTAVSDTGPAVFSPSGTNTSVCEPGSPDIFEACLQQRNISYMKKNSDINLPETSEKNPALSNSASPKTAQTAFAETTSRSPPQTETLAASQQQAALSDSKRKSSLKKSTNSMPPPNLSIPAPKSMIPVLHNATTNPPLPPKRTMPPLRVFKLAADARKMDEERIEKRRLMQAALAQAKKKRLMESKQPEKPQPVENQPPAKNPVIDSSTTSSKQEDWLLLRKKEYEEQERVLLQKLNARNEQLQKQTTQPTEPEQPKGVSEPFKADRLDDSSVAEKTPATTLDSKEDSYQMTPVRSHLKEIRNSENYDIADMKSDQSTDDEDDPRKKVPNWAQGPALRAALYNQFLAEKSPDQIFPRVETPNLVEIFPNKRTSRYVKRTSSALWTYDSPTAPFPTKRL